MQTAEKWRIGNPEFACDAVCSHHSVWPWNGHRLFGYDLVRYLRPRRLVELGTYWGTSYFAFCQAVQDEELDTELVAVDTWAGDDHTGEYGEDAYNNVLDTLRTCYPELSTQLLRMYFMDALTMVEDGSVDILHIDGCHHYDAVRQDYESWLAKLRKNGVVLFHDVADTCDYGSVKFWQELSEKHPSLTFQHSWGLGVLFPKGDLLFNQLMQNNFQDKLLVYENRSELNLMKILKDAHEERGDRQDALIKHQEKLISEIREKCADLEKVGRLPVRSYLSRMLQRIRILSGAKS